LRHLHPWIEKEGKKGEEESTAMSLVNLGYDLRRGEDILKKASSFHFIYKCREKKTDQMPALCPRWWEGITSTAGQHQRSPSRSQIPKKGKKKRGGEKAERLIVLQQVPFAGKKKRSLYIKWA